MIQLLSPVGACAIGAISLVALRIAIQVGYGFRTEAEAVSYQFHLVVFQKHAIVSSEVTTNDEQ